MLTMLPPRSAGRLVCSHTLSRPRLSALDASTLPLGIRTMARARPSRLQLSQKVAVSEKPALAKKKQPLYPPGLNRREIDLPPPPPPRPQQQAPRNPNDKQLAKVKARPEFKHLKMQRSLDIISKTQKEKARQALHDELPAEFPDYGFLPKIHESLKTDVFTDLETFLPTPVQRLAYDALLNFDIEAPVPTKPRSYLIAAETGSGKTLAYLLPVIHHMKREEILETERQAQEAEALKNAPPSSNLFEVDPAEIDPGVPRPKPRVVILLPTSELVAQVGRIVKKISHVVKFRACLLSREFSASVIHSRLAHKPDVIISTPHLFSSIAQSDPGILSKCYYLVIDEADSLFDRSFSDITKSVLVRAEKLKQLILCSATIPRSLDNALRQQYPDITRLVTPNIHAIPRRVPMTVVDVDGEPYHSDKFLACADTLYNIAREPGEEGFVKTVIVFVNSREATTPLKEYLCSKDIDAVELGRDTQTRSSNTLDYFTGPRIEFTADPEEMKKAGPRAGLKRMKVLVTTDIASRGIDTKNVRNVLLFDVPYSTVDFIHRIGRVGRMYRRGRAFVFVDKQTNKAWIREIKECMHMGQGLL
ncbi:P-loop containing nucleoside triphosphate hydrolase protein [Kalaharituber pfeilii]|nr:P-loop containing nucleoside triphosphate hydrolase protein [Kalaharituber pfeilii]